MRKSTVFLIVILSTIVIGIGGYFGYKYFTESEDQAVKDLQGGSKLIDYSAKFEVGKYTEKDNPDLDQKFWNSFYEALIEYDPRLANEYIVSFQLNSDHT